ncbi:MAG TPA: hypothetical protein ENI87_01985 [bacterium]|nr:hypothetical protein [bacterium]
MIGGLSIQGNLLCVTWSAGRGHVFLYDLEAGERLSSWTLPAGPSGFSDAGGVAVDEHFRVFVADACNDCVHRFNAFGQNLGRLGSPVPAAGDRGRDRPGVLDRPHAVAVHRRRVFVACGERPRRRGLQCFGVDGEVVRGLSARGDPAAKWGAPRGVLADARGVVVADTLRARLQCFRPDGTFVHELPCAIDGAPGRPAALARAADGAIVCVDHGVESRLVAVRPDGTGRDLTRRIGACRDPLAVTSGPQGCLFVLDHGGERVIRLRPDLHFDAVVVDLAEHDFDVPLG